MAQLSGYPEVHHIDTSLRDTSQQIPLGTRAMDVNGGEWVYLRGTASIVAGDFCRINNSDHSVERANSDDVGPIGIAGTAITAGQFGWYQVYGMNTGANCVTGAGQAAVSGPLALYLTSTGGRVGTADVAGDLIEGAFILGGIAASNIGTVWIDYPSVYNIAQD